MKLTCTVSLEQYNSIKEDLSYLESELNNQLLQPDTRCFLKQVAARAEVKLTRRYEKCRLFSGQYEKTRTP